MFKKRNLLNKNHKLQSIKLWLLQEKFTPRMFYILYIYDQKLNSKCVFCRVLYNSSRVLYNFTKIAFIRATFYTLFVYIQCIKTRIYSVIKREKLSKTYVYDVVFILDVQRFTHFLCIYNAQCNKQF